MHLKEFRDSVNNFLSEFNPHISPQFPNPIATFRETETTFSIDSGELSNLDYVKLSLTILIASTKLGDLDKNTSLIISKLYNYKFYKSRPVKDINFEFSIPDSGVWKCLIKIGVETEIANYEEQINGTAPGIKTIAHDYI